MPSVINPTSEILLPVRDYDLAATLDSGQVFRWQRSADSSSASSNSWTGIIGKHRVRLTQTHDGILAETAAPVADWHWLRDFLQTETDLAAVLKTFPDDEPMRAAVAACRGLARAAAGPWECLASFILSSTKQIVQIRQIVAAALRTVWGTAHPASGSAGVGRPMFSDSNHSRRSETGR